MPKVNQNDCASVRHNEHFRAVVSLTRPISFMCGGHSLPRRGPSGSLSRAPSEGVPRAENAHDDDNNVSTTPSNMAKSGVGSSSLLSASREAGGRQQGSNQAAAGIPNDFEVSGECTVQFLIKSGKKQLLQARSKLVNRRRPWHSVGSC